MCPLQTSAQKTQDEEEMVQPMGYKFAEKLCEEDNPEETAAKLTTEKTFRRFEALLAEKDIRHDLMKLIVSLLEILCRSRVESHFNKILGIIRKTNFWNTLAIFVNNLYSTKEASNDPSLPTLITNLCKIFNICLERLPELHSTIPISQLKVTVELFKNDGKLGDSNIEQLLEEMIKKRQQTMKEKRNTVSLQHKPSYYFNYHYRKLSTSRVHIDNIRKTGRATVPAHPLDPRTSADIYNDVRLYNKSDILIL